MMARHGGGEATDIQWVEAGDAAKHTDIQDSPP